MPTLKTALILSVLLSRALGYCTFGDPSCWPSSEEIAAFNRSLSEGSRQLYWLGGTNPRVGPFPAGSPGDQPLWGLGYQGLHPIYVRDLPANTSCFLPNSSPYFSEFCAAATRNTPREGYNPGLIVWPLTVEDVSKSVQFARKHDMCIMVAGTGHDFQNRHSCQDGLFVRMSLFKGIDWDLTDEKAFGWPEGNVKFGAGIVFSEAQKSAADHGRFVSSGWATTVGIVGWSIGGGHGPFAPTAGLGVDNILEVELVTANGSVVVANARTNRDLFWAIRGGGGSTWGIITAITIRAHTAPEKYRLMIGLMEGSMCDDGLKLLQEHIHFHQQWMLQLDQRFSGLVFYTPQFNSSNPACNSSWSIASVYAFTGNDTDAAAEKALQAINSTFPHMYLQTSSADTWNDIIEFLPVDSLSATCWDDQGYAAGVPSVLVQREKVENGALESSINSHLALCKSQGHCSRLEMYQDITGNLGSVQDRKGVSISPAFRTAMIHLVVGRWTEEQMREFYTLGESSYFSESAYLMEHWQQRYWGPNLGRLSEVKRSWDPSNVFGCRHCISA
eukprot:TRINITY_DN6003_c0_g2_i1.p1 TRINITY_DN6003_c0_g2~~TRINITY_DN6003_c0_g2_i1.p1  ORF type:complete len:558 (+),score=124.73 TRINITY_DN6003_c0_g2_i1:21-1694(+)